ncbi:hypothetical protein L3X38_014538 [Prunus dulcis]|uniref:Uncharacterized protein n=1 Tax=Prunus dulcis TaxID=3755 RepID=A0AAD4ZI33_PRUDU|nr:hypothetical protein L3X38_014538 [Prunus dulcis]
MESAPATHFCKCTIPDLIVTCKILSSLSFLATSNLKFNGGYLITEVFNLCSDPNSKLLPLSYVSSSFFRFLASPLSENTFMLNIPCDVLPGFQLSASVEILKKTYTLGP